jgi:glucose/arabinose dehydrogenase
MTFAAVRFRLVTLPALLAASWSLLACGSDSAPPSPAPAAVEGFSRAVLTRDAKNPLALALTPDGDVYYVERTGELRLYQARSGRVLEAAKLEVETAYENGLLGLVLDPAFADNRHLYLYYSAPLDPSITSGPPGRNLLVRFTARADGSLDPESRLELLSVPSERRCCHEGGSLAFAADGTLLLSTGDNTNPFESQGAAPIDGRPGRERLDARRTSGNPFDLRGKILRLEPDGGVPPGNLFPPDGSLGRPEIYVMGVRNPFRIAADPREQRLFFGDVGPDAENDGARGPRGYDEINLATAPGDYGWPRCIGENLPYADFDFETGTSNGSFDCDDKAPALLAYDYTTASYAALGTGYSADGVFLGRTAIAGAVYRSSAAATSRLPARFEGALLMADWARNLLAAVTVTPEHELSGVERLVASEDFRRPIDIEVGADGALYVLEYGSDFWGDNPDARLSRLEYGALDALAPVAELEASPAVGPAPLTVELSATGSRAAAPGATVVDFGWDLDADGNADAHGERLTHTFEESGEYDVGLTVTADNGVQSRPVSLRIVVGNAAPSVRILAPLRGASLSLSRPILLIGEASDPEDGVAACDELSWNISLVHASHAHPLGSVRGCEASFTADAADHANETGHLSYAVELVYTDHGGANGEPPLTGRQGLHFEVVAP